MLLPLLPQTFPAPAAVINVSVGRYLTADQTVRCDNIFIAIVKLCHFYSNRQALSMLLPLLPQTFPAPAAVINVSVGRYLTADQTVRCDNIFIAIVKLCHFYSNRQALSMLLPLLPQTFPAPAAVINVSVGRYLTADQTVRCDNIFIAIVKLCVLFFTMGNAWYFCREQRGRSRRAI